MRWTLPETALLEAAACGDPDARAGLLRTLAPVVLRWCTHLGDGGADPEDTAHDVLTLVLDNLSSVRDLRAFPRWLWQVTTREVVRHDRRARVRAWLPLGERHPDQFVDEDAEGVSVQERVDTVRRVRDAIGSLPPKQREVLFLCELEGLTDQETADLLGLPLGTIKSRLARARASFVREVRRRGIAVPELQVSRSGER